METIRETVRIGSLLVVYAAIAVLSISGNAQGLENQPLTAPGDLRSEVGSTANLKDGSVLIATVGYPRGPFGSEDPFRPRIYVTRVSDQGDSQRDLITALDDSYVSYPQVNSAPDGSADLMYVVTPRDSGRNTIMFASRDPETAHFGDPHALFSLPGNMGRFSIARAASGLLLVYELKRGRNSTIVYRFISASGEVSSTRRVMPGFHFARDLYLAGADANRRGQGAISYATREKTSRKWVSHVAIIRGEKMANRIELGRSLGLNVSLSDHGQILITWNVSRNYRGKCQIKKFKPPFSGYPIQIVRDCNEHRYRSSRYFVGSPGSRSRSVLRQSHSIDGRQSDARRESVWIQGTSSFRNRFLIPFYTYRNFNYENVSYRPGAVIAGRFARRSHRTKLSPWQQVAYGMESGFTNAGVAAIAWWGKDSRGSRISVRFPANAKLIVLRSNTKKGVRFPQLTPLGQNQFVLTWYRVADSSGFGPEAEVQYESFWTVLSP